MVMIDGKEICLDSLKPYEPHCITIEKEVLLPNDHGGNYVIRHRYKTPREIYAELSKALDLTVCGCGHEFKPKKWDTPCPKCKQEDNGDRHQLVDEYDSCCHFSGDEHKEIADRSESRYTIAVYSERGGSEGYSVYVTVIFYSRDQQRAVNVYRIKSFRGFDHCDKLVKRIMELMGLRD